jgi:hypothetical protein
MKTLDYIIESFEGELGELFRVTVGVQLLVKRGKLFLKYFQVF